ncbi:hypothetical protein C4546_01370 [Candidatus Parcubacteria bacterium]|jgi:hypothetical protein|nr:MAG: hypothetical protein C4546_01370 [Candidatus Parcubacteria bacterium]
MLSPLQKFILKESQGTKITKRILFKKFYLKNAKPPKPEDQQNAITKSLERIIDRGFLIGYGRRTPKKWYIESVKLTPKGKRLAKSLLGKQQKFSFK